jgi:hypothetical protein
MNLYPFEPRRFRPEGCLSDLMLDRLVAGELTGAPDELEIQAHLVSCRLCQARVSELGAERPPPVPWPTFGEELALPPPAPVEELTATVKLPRPPPPPPRRLRQALRFVAPLAIAAGALFFLRPLAPDAMFRAKGAPFQLALVVRSPDGAVEGLVPGGPVSPGDELRFQISTDRPGHLAILGIDSAQQITSYLTAEPTLPAFPAGRDQLLEGSVVLDDTLGAERIVAVLCPQARELSAVVELARAALVRARGEVSKLEPLGSGCEETSVQIDKVKR